MIADPSLYRKAFDAYLRKGTPILWSVKQDRPTTQYIWRTRRDGKVRSAHADREGQIFSWEEPPEGGHPGQDYNCRCTAEPYYPEISEYMDLIIDGFGTKSGWSNEDFVEHYFNGRGRGVTLTEIGHHDAIVEEYFKRRAKALKGQIATAARRVATGAVSYDFGRPYDMQSISFSIGDTVIGGVFTGYSEEHDGILNITGSLEFYQRDEFADPLDIGERLRGIGIENAPDVEVDDYRPGRVLYDNLHKPLNDYLRGRLGLPATGGQNLGIREGVPYSITSEWSGRLEGRIYADASRSRY